MVKGFTRLSVALAIALLVATGAQADVSPLTHRGDHRFADKLVVGLAYGGTPFAYLRDGKPRGFELDLMRAVAEEMEVEIEVRWFKRDELVPALAAGDVHVVNVGAVRDKLPPDIDVIPYFLTGVHAVVRRDNPFAIHSADDLSGTMVFATMGSAGEGYAREIRSRMGEAGKAPMEIHTAPMAQYTPTAVLFTHASAYFAPTAAVALQAADSDPGVRAVPGLFKPTGSLGFGLRINDGELKMYLRLALARVVVKGVYADLLAAYNIPDDGSPFR